MNLNVVATDLDSQLANWYLRQLHRSTDAALVREALEFEWLPKQSEHLKIESCRFLGVEQVSEQLFGVHYSLLFTGVPGLPREWVGEITTEGEQKQAYAEQLTGGSCLQDSVNQYICLNSLNLLLRPAGVDEAIPGLELLHDPERTMQTVGTLFGAPTVEAVQVELVQARLSEMAVLRFHAAQKGRWSSLIGVAHGRSHDTWASFQNWQQLSVAINHQSDVFAVADPIAYLPEVHMIVLEDWMQGRGGESCMAESFYRNCGALLQAWHDCGVTDESASTEPSHLFWADYIGSFMPTLKRSAFAVGELVQRETDLRLEQNHQLIHGSFGLQTVVADQNRAVAKFATTSGAGDPARDLGVFLASAQMARIIHNTMDSGLSWAFLSGYSQADETMRSRIIAFQRASLYQFAYRFSLWPKRRYLCKPLLETAQSTVD